jgi:hypothetical protein
MKLMLEQYFKIQLKFKQLNVIRGEKIIKPTFLLYRLIPGYDSIINVSHLISANLGNRKR